MRQRCPTCGRNTGGRWGRYFAKPVAEYIDSQGDVYTHLPPSMKRQVRKWRSGEIWTASLERVDEVLVAANLTLNELEAWAERTGVNLDATL